MNLFKSTLLAAGMLVSTSMMAIKVHTIGDSTMATYSESTTVTRGWGQMFQQFFTDAVTVNNRAKSGASSKSFYEEAAYWESVKKQIQPGDYVLIQFAHNDEKNDGMDGDEVKAYYESIGDQAKPMPPTNRAPLPAEPIRNICANMLKRHAPSVPLRCS